MDGNIRLSNIFKPSTPTPCSHCGRPSKIIGVYYEGVRTMKYHVCDECFHNPAKMKALRAEIEARFARHKQQ
jgi:hypothetical protein